MALASSQPTNAHTLQLRQLFGRPERQRRLTAELHMLLRNWFAWLRASSQTWHMAPPPGSNAKLERKLGDAVARLIASNVRTCASGPCRIPARRRKEGAVVWHGAVQLGGLNGGTGAAGERALEAVPSVLFCRPLVSDS